MLGDGFFEGASVEAKAKILAAAFVLLLGVLVVARPAHAATFTVNSTDDGFDVARDGVCDSNSSTFIETCTLRAAVQESNRSTATDDTINFDISGTELHTISPTSGLPAITDKVTINRYSQPGASQRASNASPAVLKIRLDGLGAGTGATGLTVGPGGGGTRIEGLAIGRFREDGVFIDAADTVIGGNYIGTNAAGDADRGNVRHGVHVRSSGNVIGGAGAGEMNIISGNGTHGVQISGTGTSNNRIEGNRIGTDASGTSALGNLEGVFVSGASGNFIGGPEVGASNLISGNLGRGVVISSNAANNRVQSNFIGINVFNADLGNGDDGVELFQSSNNVIGGTASRTANIISGNDADGVELTVGASNNRVEGNLIGTAQNGTSDLGNGQVGVRVLGADNTVGGTVSRARNVISGNGGVGVSIGSDADRTTVQGNRIGPGVNGEDLGGESNSDGVLISHGSSGNTIGGTATGAANTISFNENHGVVIEGFASGTTGNRISANSIHSNGLLGINLVGGEETNGAVTNNDRKDPDGGPNLLQNLPVIASASTTQVTGTLNSLPRRSFTIQFFSNPVANVPTGFGEGETFLGQRTVRTNRRGNASFTFATTLAAGQVVTATATDASGNTSEFSQGRFVQ